MIELSEVRRTLCRDASHAILIVDPPVEADLAARIANEIGDETRVEIAHLAGLDRTRASRLLLAALGVPGYEPQPEARVRTELEARAKVGASLVVVLPDALAVERDVLRWLGGLARASGKGLRFALLTEPGRPGERDPARRIVEALGTGAARVELCPHRPRVTEAEIAVKTPLPPVVPPLGKRPRPIPVRGARGRRLPSLAAALAVAGLLAALTAPAVIFTRAPEPVAPSPPPLVPASGPPAVSAPLVPELPAAAALPAAVVPAPEPEPEEPLPAPAELPAPPTPEPVVRVRVNLNASPWAEIAVDGRPVGPTPIADLSVAPGLRRIRATFPDGRVVERDLRVDELQNRFRIE